MTRKPTEGSLEGCFEDKQVTKVLCRVFSKR